MKEYDVIIVGAGVGGLTSGALLAKRGLKVLLLEKNNFVGGYCSSFERKGFLFDSCVHWFSGCGPGSFIDKIFKKIGVEMDFIKYNPMDRFHFSDQEIIVPENITDYKKKLIAMYPEERESIKSFFEEMKISFDTVMSFIYGYIEGGGDFRFNNSDFLGCTYQELLEKYFTKSSLKAILSAQWGFVGSIPQEASALMMMTMMHNYYHEGAYYPRGGAQSFSDQLASSIRRQGGEVKLNSEVVDFRFENGKIDRVRLQTGEEYKASLFISNFDAKHTVNSLIDFSGNRKWKDFKNRINNKMKESMSMFILYLALDIPGEELVDKIGWYYYKSLSELDKYNQSYFPGRDGYLINIPSVLDSSICPEDKSVMIVYKEPEKYYMEGEDTDWDELRDVYEKKCLNFVNQSILKNVEDYLEFKVSATPKTLYNYTYNSKGAAYGWAHTPAQLWNKRMPIESPVDNLLFAGHWTIPGGSVILAAISGWLANLKVLKVMNNRQDYN